MSAELDAFLTKTRTDFLAILKSPTFDLNDRAAFSKAIYLATHVCMVSRQDMATACGVEMETLCRWAAGSSPKSRMNRQGVLRWLQNHLHELVTTTPAA